MKAKGLIFDYGGTIDTNGCHWAMRLWHGYQRHDMPVTLEQFRAAYVEAERTLARTPIIQSDYTFRKTLAAKLRIQFDYLLDKGILTNSNFSLASKKSLILEDLYNLTTEDVHNAREVLLKLKEKYPLVLVSNFYGNLNVVLAEFGLDGVFDSVIESAVVGVRKPDPEIFKMGLKALGLQPNDVVLVGDSLDKDILPAHQLGIQTVWLRGEQWSEPTSGTDIPNKTIKDIKELINLFSL